MEAIRRPALEGSGVSCAGNSVLYLYAGLVVTVPQRGTYVVERSNG